MSLRCGLRAKMLEAHESLGVGRHSQQIVLVEIDAERLGVYDGPIEAD